MAVPAPYQYNATVIRIVDGDTIEAVIDRGMYDYTGTPTKPIPVRVAGINAIEYEDPGGKEACDNLAMLIPPGTRIVLHTVKPDKYAPRWDARIETPTIPDLTTHLTATGWAAPWTGYGRKPIPPWPRPHQ